MWALLGKPNAEAQAAGLRELTAVHNVMYLTPISHAPGTVRPASQLVHRSPCIPPVRGRAYPSNRRLHCQQ